MMLLPSRDSITLNTGYPNSDEVEVQLRLMRHCEGRVSKRESKRDRERERARRQPFKIQFPGSEEANPASVIPCSRSKPPSILPSLPIIITSLLSH